MSKKKAALVLCERCGLYLTAACMTNHPDNCDLQPKTTFVRPGNFLAAINNKLDRRNELLPSSSIGWHKHHTVLISPQALELLGVLPRTPCLLKSDETEAIVMLWPCSELQALRVNASNVSSERFVTLEVISSVEPLRSLTFEPVGPIDPSLLSAAHFAAYLKIFLSNAFVATNLPIEVQYLAKTYRFELVEDICIEMEKLKMDSSEDKPRVFRVETTAKIMFASRLKQKHQPSVCDPFDNVGGSSSAKECVNQYLFSPIKKSIPPCSLIIHGFTGCGKSLFINCIAQKLGQLSVNVRTMKHFHEVQKELQPNSILLVDCRPSTADSTTFTDQLCEIMDQNKCASVVLTTSLIDQLDIRLRRRFEVEVELMVPSAAERNEIFALKLPAKYVGMAKELARDTHGFTGADIDVLCRKLALLEANRHPNPVNEARKLTDASGIKQFILEVPNVPWESIGGNESLKQEIKQAVIWPYEHPEAFERLGVPPPNGILLYGPPGCSKTLIARALASQSKLNFLSVKGPELFSKWVGESERAVRELFHRARQVSPTILFFDEVDALATKRGEDKSSAVSDRVLAQMLTELDGLERSAGVFVVAATNRPDTLDSALLRPGRLDRAVYVPLPDYQTRQSIIQLQFAQIRVASDVDVDQLAQRTEGFSGAELVALCRSAALSAMRESLAADEVGASHFDQSFQMVPPRTDLQLLRVYEKFAAGGR